MSSGGWLQETPAAFMKKCREMKRRFSAWKEEFIMEKSIKRYMPIFVLPTFFAFILGFIVPFIMGIWLSFCKFTTVTDAKFVGFSNYIEALKDTAFRHSFWYTVLCLVTDYLYHFRRHFQFTRNTFFFCVHYAASNHKLYQINLFFFRLLQMF